MRKATAVDWAGDPVQVEKNHFSPLHGEKNYQQMLEHFEKYNDIVGDDPINLEATSLAFNAYALTHEPKYKNWLLEYVDAWLNRMQLNGGIIPSNVGLDGVIGSGAGGSGTAAFTAGASPSVTRSPDNWPTATSTSWASPASATRFCSPAKGSTSTPGGQ